VAFGSRTGHGLRGLFPHSGSIARGAGVAEGAYSRSASNGERIQIVTTYMASRDVSWDKAQRMAQHTRPGVATVSSAALMPAPAHVVYRFLERLSNHALITGRRLRLEGVTDDGRGGRIALRGPFGIRRVARTSVTTLDPPRGFGGTAVVGRRTAAYVHWGIEDAEGGSLVTLSATITRAGVLDRLLLATGGRRWLARSFARSVALLQAAVEGAPRTGEHCARMVN
jgi:hypothetical protein